MTSKDHYHIPVVVVVVVVEVVVVVAVYFQSPLLLQYLDAVDGGQEDLEETVVLVDHEGVTQSGLYYPVVVDEGVDVGVVGEYYDDLSYHSHVAVVLGYEEDENEGEGGGQEEEDHCLDPFGAVVAGEVEVEVEVGCNRYHTKEKRRETAVIALQDHLEVEKKTKKKKKKKKRKNVGDEESVLVVAYVGGLVEVQSQYC